MISHSVIFKLRVAKNFAQEQVYFDVAKKLANIPVVWHFELLKQTTKKNNFDYGISMEFANQRLYNNYSNHPEHLPFIKEYWLKYVENFLEIDYEPMN